VLPIPVPEEPTEQACPIGCTCLAKDEAAKKFGPDAILCLKELCGYADAAKQVPLYCWKPAEVAKCPEGCYCMTVEAAKERGYTERCQADPCGRDQYQNPLYCFKAPVAETCLTGCACLTKDDVYKRYGDKIVLCQEKPCGYEGNIEKYCWKVPITASCPVGCACLTEAEAKKLGYTSLCQGQKTICGYDAQQNPLYCFIKPQEIVQPKVGKIVIDLVSDRNPVGTRHNLTIMVYDTNGQPMANVWVKVRHTGANPFAPIELVTDASGKTGYYYDGRNIGTDTIVATADSVSARATKEWYQEIKPAKIELSPSVGHNLSGQRHTVTATVWGTDGEPMAGITVNFAVSGTTQTG